MGSSVIRRRAVVRGHVQGVFFRDSTREHADRCGVAGWACNRDDGSVEVVLEGEPGAVESLLAFLRKGPSQAVVRELAVTEEEPEGLRGFSIR